MITAIDKNTALVLIDLQKGIVGMNGAHDSSIVVANAAKLVAAFRKANLPIIAVHVNPIGSAASKVRAEKSMLPKDDAGQKAVLEKMEEAGFFTIVPELGIQEGDLVVLKSTWNAFHATNLNAALQERNITGIVLAGISTSIGVESTARTANENGYNITFVEDAMTDMVLAAHENSIKNIFPRIGEIGTVEEVITKLNEFA
jgi:nicotinamidase-related amidase